MNVTISCRVFLLGDCISAITVLTSGMAISDIQTILNIASQYPIKVHTTKVSRNVDIHRPAVQLVTSSDINPDISSSLLMPDQQKWTDSGKLPHPSSWSGQTEASTSTNELSVGSPLTKWQESKLDKASSLAGAGFSGTFSAMEAGNFSIGRTGDIDPLKADESRDRSGSGTYTPIVPKLKVDSQGNYNPVHLEAYQNDSQNKLGQNEITLSDSEFGPSVSTAFAVDKTNYSAEKQINDSFQLTNDSLQIPKFGINNPAHILKTLDENLDASKKLELDETDNKPTGMPRFGAFAGNSVTINAELHNHDYETEKFEMKPDESEYELEDAMKDLKEFQIAVDQIGTISSHQTGNILSKGDQKFSVQGEYITVDKSFNLEPPEFNIASNGISYKPLVKNETTAGEVGTSHSNTIDDRDVTAHANFGLGLPKQEGKLDMAQQMGRISPALGNNELRLQTSAVNIPEFSSKELQNDPNYLMSLQKLTSLKMESGKDFLHNSDPVMQFNTSNIHVNHKQDLNKVENDAEGITFGDNLGSHLDMNMMADPHPLNLSHDLDMNVEGSTPELDASIPCEFGNKNANKAVDSSIGIPSYEIGQAHMFLNPSDCVYLTPATPIVLVDKQKTLLKMSNIDEPEHTNGPADISINNTISNADSNLEDDHSFQVKNQNNKGHAIAMKGNFEEGKGFLSQTSSTLHAGPLKTENTHVKFSDLEYEAPKLNVHRPELDLKVQKPKVEVEGPHIKGHLSKNQFHNGEAKPNKTGFGAKLKGLFVGNRKASLDESKLKSKSFAESHHKIPISINENSSLSVKGPTGGLSSQNKMDINAGTDLKHPGYISDFNVSHVKHPVELSSDVVSAEQTVVDVHPPQDINIIGGKNLEGHSNFKFPRISANHDQLNNDSSVNVALVEFHGNMRENPQNQMNLTDDMNVNAVSGIHLPHESDKHHQESIKPSHIYRKGPQLIQDVTLGMESARESSVEDGLVLGRKSDVHLPSVKILQDISAKEGHFEFDMLKANDDISAPYQASENSNNSSFAVPDVGIKTNHEKISNFEVSESPAEFSMPSLNTVNSGKTLKLAAGVEGFNLNSNITNAQIETHQTAASEHIPITLSPGTLLRGHEMALESFCVPESKIKYKAPVMGAIKPVATAMTAGGSSISSSNATEISLTSSQPTLSTAITSSNYRIEEQVQKVLVPQAEVHSPPKKKGFFNFKKKSDSKKDTKTRLHGEVAAESAVKRMNVSLPNERKDDSSYKTNFMPPLENLKPRLEKEIKNDSSALLLKKGDAGIENLRIDKTRSFDSGVLSMSPRVDDAQMELNPLLDVLRVDSENVEDRIKLNEGVFSNSHDISVNHNVSTTIPEAVEQSHSEYKLDNFIISNPQSAQSKAEEMTIPEIQTMHLEAPEPDISNFKMNADLSKLDAKLSEPTRLPGAQLFAEIPTFHSEMTNVSTEKTKLDAQYDSARTNYAIPKLHAELPRFKAGLEEHQHSVVRDFSTEITLAGAPKVTSESREPYDEIHSLQKATDNDNIDLANHDSIDLANHSGKPQVYLASTPLSLPHFDEHSVQDESQAVKIGMTGPTMPVTDNNITAPSYNVDNAQIVDPRLLSSILKTDVKPQIGAQFNQSNLISEISPRTYIAEEISKPHLEFTENIQVPHQVNTPVLHAEANGSNWESSTLVSGGPNMRISQMPVSSVESAGINVKAHESDIKMSTPSGTFVNIPSSELSNTIEFTESRSQKKGLKEKFKGFFNSKDDKKLQKSHTFSATSFDYSTPSENMMVLHQQKKTNLEVKLLSPSGDTLSKDSLTHLSADAANTLQELDPETNTDYVESVSHMNSVKIPHDHVDRNFPDFELKSNRSNTNDGIIKLPGTHDQEFRLPAPELELEDSSKLSFTPNEIQSHELTSDTSFNPIFNSTDLTTNDNKHPHTLHLSSSLIANGHLNPDLENYPELSSNQSPQVALFAESKTIEIVRKLDHILNITADKDLDHKSTVKVDTNLDQKLGISAHRDLDKKLSTAVHHVDGHDELTIKPNPKHNLENVSSELNWKFVHPEFQTTKINSRQNEKIIGHETGISSTNHGEIQQSVDRVRLPIVNSQTSDNHIDARNGLSMNANDLFGSDDEFLEPLKVDTDFAWPDFSSTREVGNFELKPRNAHSNSNTDYFDMNGGGVEYSENGGENDRRPASGSENFFFGMENKRDASVTESAHGKKIQVFPSTEKRETNIYSFREVNLPPPSGWKSSDYSLESVSQASTDNQNGSAFSTLDSPSDPEDLEHLDGKNSNLNSMEEFEPFYFGMNQTKAAGDRVIFTMVLTLYCIIYLFHFLYLFLVV